MDRSDRATGSAREHDGPSAEREVDRRAGGLCGDAQRPARRADAAAFVEVDLPGGDGGGRGGGGTGLGVGVDGGGERRLDRQERGAGDSRSAHDGAVLGGAASRTGGRWGISAGSGALLGNQSGCCFGGVAEPKVSWWLGRWKRQAQTVLSDCGQGRCNGAAGRGAARSGGGG